MLISIVIALDMALWLVGTSPSSGSEMVLEPLPVSFCNEA